MIDTRPLHFNTLRIVLPYDRGDPGRASTMSIRRQTPIVVGVGDIVNRSRRIEDAVEPVELMLGAIESAVRDTGLAPAAATALQAEIDSLDVIKCWTWPYPDLPGLIAQRLAIKPLRKYQSSHGGNQPGLLFDEAARRISKGESTVALLTGGEALASCTVLPHDIGRVSTDERSIRLCSCETATAA